jgi:hypothetical protein
MPDRTLPQRLANLNTALPKLEELLEEFSDHCGYEDPIAIAPLVMLIHRHALPSAQSAQPKAGGGGSSSPPSVSDGASSRFAPAA